APRVGPDPPEAKPGALGDRLEFRDLVLVAAFGDDRFALIEREREPTASPGTAHVDVLRTSTHEPHFDPAVSLVVRRMVLEGAGIEIGAELAVQTNEHVQVERRRDAFGVVVGEFEAGPQI